MRGFLYRNQYSLVASLATLCLAAYFFPAKKEEADTDWRHYGGDSGGTRFSPLTQINVQNVGSLRQIWSYDTGENKDTAQRGIDIQCQPIVAEGVLYATTPRMKLFALDAASGKELWKFDPFDAPDAKPRIHPVRGVAYWSDGADKRILYSVGPTLYAVDAVTGKRITGFGKNGATSLHQGLGTVSELGYDVTQYTIRSTSPGVVFRDLIIMGSSVSEGGDGLPGNIRAFDVRTGRLRWSFRTIPLPGEYGHNTWSPDSYRKLGGANCWAGMVVDQKNGMVFLGTGSPSVDFYGGDREGQNLFANCVIALDAATGKRIWHFQTVHHDLWDHDIPCPPNLLTVMHRGKPTDAVAQATKSGHVFVFDRMTGQPLFPVEEVKVPVSPALPGEKPWPTQPVPVKPAPFARQFLTPDQVTERTPEARRLVLDRLLESRSGNKYLPPSLEGTLYYGFGGGAEWGGAAVDPSGVFYVNGNNMLWWLKMRENDAIKSPGNRGKMLFGQNCSVCHSQETIASGQSYPSLREIGKRMTPVQIDGLLITGRGRMPSFQHLSKEDRKALVDFLIQGKDTAVNAAEDDIHRADSRQSHTGGSDFPYTPPFLPNGMVQFRDPDHYPAIKPPWGTLNAIDLNTGEYRWQVPLGEYPALGEPSTGTENHGGPLVTAGNLLFIGATYDEHLRAFNTTNGEEVWRSRLPAGGFATPVTYRVSGKQYVVIAAGGVRYGKKAGSSYVAYALPQP